MELAEKSNIKNWVHSVFFKDKPRWVVLADLSYLILPIFSIFNSDFLSFYLLGMLGICTLTFSVLRVDNDDIILPSWWFFPALLFPWTTYFRTKNRFWFNHGNQKGDFRIGGTIILLIIATIFSLGWYKPAFDPVVSKFVEPGKEYVEEVQVKTAGSFIIARSLNALLSVIESFEAGAAVVSADIGSVLEPLDDLVERFSWVMLVAFSAMTAIQLFGEIGPGLGLEIILPVGIIVLVAGLWVSDKKYILNWFGIRLIMVSLVFYFLVPFMGLVVFTLDNIILSEVATNAEDKVSQFSRFEPSHAVNDEESWAGTLTLGMADTAGRLVDRLDYYKNEMKQVISNQESIVNGIVTLIVVFTLRSIVIPVLSVWGLIRFARWLIGRPYLAQKWEERVQS